MKLNRPTRLATLVAIVLAVTAALGVAAASASPARHTGRTRITMMIGGINKIIYATATLAKQLGYYDKAGVDVYPIDSPAGIEEADALVAGQIDAAMGYYNHTIDLAGKGKATECVVQIGLTPGHAILVPTNSSIHSLATRCRRDESPFARSRATSTRRLTPTSSAAVSANPSVPRSCSSVVIATCQP